MFRANLFIVLFVVSGCGAATASSPYAAGEARLVSDADLYTAAYTRAFDAYEARVEMSRTRTYRSHAEAEALSRTISGARFDALLERSLAESGLTVRGFRYFQANHPEQRRALDERYRDRLSVLVRQAGELDQQVRSGSVAYFDVPDDPAHGRLASALTTPY